MEKTEIITPKLKELILKECYQKGNRLCIDFPNSRLDFSQTYYLNKFTKKGIKLSWVNGSDEVNVFAKLEKRTDDFALYTEGWRYIKRIKVKNE